MLDKNVSNINKDGFGWFSDDSKWFLILNDSRSDMQQTTVTMLARNMIWYYSVENTII